MLSGEVVEVHDYVAEQMVLRGEAEKIDVQNVNATTQTIEMATLEPKTEQARIKYERTPKSRSDEVKTWLESLFKHNQAQSQ
jgi:hypothetical protein